MFNQYLSSTTDKTQGRLLGIAALFLLFYTSALTLSTAVKGHSWLIDYDWEHWLGYLIWLATFTLLHWQTSVRIPDRDPYLLPIAALLTGWGLLTIWRLQPDFGFRQSMWVLVSVGVVSLGLRLPADLEFLRRYKYLWLTSGLILTALTLVFGTNPLGYGPRLWLGCCGFYLQPSEPLKLLLIVYLSAYLADRSAQTLNYSEDNQPFKGSTPLLPLLAPTLFMTGLALLLLIVQRDLGTASIFLFLYASILYIATGRKRTVLISALTLLLAVILGYLLFDVVSLRIDAWINPWIDPSGRSYQIVQSLLAVANGGLFGRGPGMGEPQVVPISHSDFIYAAIAEETGLIGTFALLLLIAIFISRGIRIAFQAPNAFRRYLAAGLTAYLGGQSILIIGGNLRLFPLTGVTLPFVSYGGSSLLTSSIALLLLLLISNEIEQDRAIPSTINQPSFQLSTLLLAGIAAITLVSGWWAFVRGPDLLTRTDNPRRSIADRFVRRGALLDRTNEVIAYSSGDSGEYQREILYPPLSPVIGYTNPIYGQSGLEASLDPYLRGLRGIPGLQIWWDNLLYGQPPPGLDVRLSLDLKLQKIVDEGMGANHGAAILLNSQTGEILAMASHPNFDANQLEENWNDLIQDEDSPLINRATQGRYPIGDIAETLFPEGYSSYGLDNAPQINLPVSEPPTEGDSRLSPLQAALGATYLSTAGLQPHPVLSLAINTPQAGWVLLPPQGNSQQVISARGATERVRDLSVEGQQFWQYATVVEEDEFDKTATWYLGGTLPTWQGTPLTLALLIEQDDLNLAQTIGQKIISAVLMP